MAELSKNRIDASTEARARIGHWLHVRAAPAGTTIARWEDVAKRGGMKVWCRLVKRPSIGVVLASGFGMAVASVVGVGELTIAIAVGYAAFQVLREGLPPGAAVEDMARRLEKLV